MNASQKSVSFLCVQVGVKHDREMNHECITKSVSFLCVQVGVKHDREMNHECITKKCFISVCASWS